MLRKPCPEPAAGGKGYSRNFFISTPATIDPESNFSVFSALPLRTLRFDFFFFFFLYFLRASTKYS